MSTQFAVDLLFRTQNGKKLRDVANQLQGIDAKGKGAQRSLDGTARGLNNTSRAAATATGNIQRFGVAFRSTVAPIVAAYGAINFFNKSLSVMGDRERDAAVLANGLRKVGAEASQLERLQKIASKLGEQTLFNQEDFTQGFALLTSFRAIGVSSYERVSKAAADMATVTKTGVNESLLQLSKALENPVQGMSALSRSGTTFTEAQKGVVKALVESGRQLEAQEYLLKIVEGQYKGASKEAAKGFAGQMDTLNETFRDFQEVVGKAVLPIVTDLIKELTGAFRALSKLDPKLLSTAGKAAVLAAKLLLVHKAVKAFIGLRAAAVGAAVAMSGGFRGMQGAAVFAASGVNALSAAIKRFLPLAVAFAAFNYLQSGNNASDQLKSVNERLAKGGTGGLIASGGSAQTREVVLEAQKNARARKAALEKALKENQPAAKLSLLGGDSKSAPASTRQQLIQAQLKDIDTILKLDANKFKTQAELIKEGFNDIANPDDGSSSSSSGGSGQSATDLAKEQLKVYTDLTREFGRELELRKASGDLDRELLQIKYDSEDRQAQINELLDAGQRANLTQLSTDLKRLEVAEAMVKAVKSFNEAKLMGASYDDGEVARLGELDERYKTLAGTISGSLTQGFRDVVTGAKSAQQALADTFQKIGDAFLDMAMKMIQEWIKMQILGIIKNAATSGLSVGGTDWGSMGTSQFGGGFGVAGAGFGKADGGKVNAGGLHLVGERGPELFAPSTAGNVISHEQIFAVTRQAMASSANGSPTTDAADAFTANDAVLGQSRAAAERSSERAQMAAMANGSVDVKFETVRIGQMDFVTPEQLMESNRMTAKQARSQVFADLKNKPSARAAIGLR